MYRDTITYQELANTNVPASGYLRECVAILADKSGADNVTSGRITRWDDHAKRTIELRVSFDSAAWTGLYRRPWEPRDVRYSRALRHRLWVYLRVGLRKAIHDAFQHSWDWQFDECEVCHLTAEERADHSWRHFPSGVAVRA